jgi:hypothetical protein
MVISRQPKASEADARTLANPRRGIALKKKRVFFKGGFIYRGSYEQ